MDKIEVINLVEYAVLDITDHRMCNIYHLFWWSDTIKGMEIPHMLQDFLIWFKWVPSFLLQHIVHNQMGNSFFNTN